MGKLIDAEKLKEKILRECIIKQEVQKAIVRAIDEQPTAYYVDKVVEELKQYEVKNDGVSTDCIIIPSFKAIEIVKKGGK